MSPDRLLLWDLDETLVTTGGAGERSFERAAEEVFGVSISMDDIDYSGRTDSAIGSLVQQVCGLPENDESIDRYLASFLHFLPIELPLNKPRVLPGVERLTSMVLESNSHAQGLLTGNLAAGAKIKLKYFGLWERFLFGAFSDDSSQREELGPVAMKRATTAYNKTFTAENTVVIGDTLRDVSCAHAFGARCLAVASGSHSVEQLRSAGADCVVDSLEDGVAVDFIGIDC
ncbi:MAG: hydrolase [Opitutae bacterium]|nr:hydrolase [Opitutae bacterium]|tara:strand:+ start:31140 stop:31829 length:690 start_codon:yes stop_codon:yes gene_type:complete